MLGSILSKKKELCLVGRRLQCWTTVYALRLPWYNRTGWQGVKHCPDITTLVDRASNTNLLWLLLFTVMHSWCADIKSTQSLLILLDVTWYIIVPDFFWFCMPGGVPRNVPLLEKAGSEVKKRTILFRTVSIIPFGSVSAGGGKRA